MKLLAFFLLYFLNFEDYCYGLASQTGYQYLFTLIVSREHVPGQENLKVCSAVELVEEQFYLAPKICFSKPEKNMEIKVALIRKKKLSFKTMIFEPYILRWETFSDYVVLERSDENIYEVITTDSPSARQSQEDIQYVKLSEGDSDITKTLHKTAELEVAESNSFTDKVDTSSQIFTQKENRDVHETKTLDEQEYLSNPKTTIEGVTNARPVVTTNDQMSSTESSERHKRYINYKAHFKQRHSRTKKDQQPNHPPFFPKEDDLPPRVLLTVPHNPLFTNCYTLGWGTFFSEKNTLDDLEGLELKRSAVNDIKPGITNSSKGFYYTEIWFERENKESYIEDIGSPMVCEVRDRGGAEVLIGMYMGGNDTVNHVFDCYRSFKGEFSYITHWAIGANVSLTGDPSTWTLWPVEYADEPKSESANEKINYQFLSLFLLTIFVLN